MKNTYISLVMLLVVFGFISASQAQLSNLQDGFKNPPASAKARTWWHWINGNVTKEGITADLEAMKRVGIQEVQLFNVDQGYPEGPAVYLGAQWLDLFQFAASEAKRLELEMSFHNGAGWSSSGGPWVQPEHAMQTVVFSEVKRSGNRKLNESLPRPEIKFDYYQDIAVIAFPTPKKTVRINDLGLKSLSGESFKNHLNPDTVSVYESSVVHQGSIVDLTNHLSSEGVLNWDMPEGEWTIVRFGHTIVGTENRPANKEGRGLECDKMSREAVGAYWEGGVQPIIDKLGPLVGTSLVSCLIDSYEVGNNNWTVGFEDEFRQRRNYDIAAFLPVLAGYYVESGEVTERFLWDFRRTIGDLIADNYYGYFAELCHQHGLKFSVEPYGGPFEAMQVGTKGDIVMSEFWLGNDVYMDSPKLTASIAYLNGSPIVGAEAFTSIGGWRNHPATMKSKGDLIWSEGVNRLIFHTYVHQPWDVAPGVTFHMYGLDMNRLNTWWDQGKAYMDYLARSQFMLQQGKPVADVLVFTGESSPNDGRHRPDIKALGYDYHEIGASQIQDLSVKEGWICTTAGLRYRLLVLPNTTWMTAKLLSKINELVRSGATIIGFKPEKSPSFQDASFSVEKYQKLVAQTWEGQSNKVITDRSVQEVLKDMKIVPDFTAGTQESDLRFIHRKAGELDIYFVANPRKESREEICYFRVQGKQPQFWNPQTGEMTDVVVWNEEADGTISVPISFDAEASVFVVFKEKVNQLHLLKADHLIEERNDQPLPGLQIAEAHYGVFLPDGLADVTETLKKYIADNKINFVVDNALSGDDPAAGSVKELRVMIKMDDQYQIIRATENTEVFIRSPSYGKWEMVKGIYGKFPHDMEGVPETKPPVDITDRVRQMVESNELKIIADDRLLAKVRSDESNAEKELRIVYSQYGDKLSKRIQYGDVLNLTADLPEPRLEYDDKGIANWLTPYPGKINYVTSSGSTKTASVGDVPDPISLTGPWEVSFSANSGAPAQTKLDSLFSLSDATEAGIRYFSGTASYRKQFSVPRELIIDGHLLELDLGSVCVIAEVIVNGKNMGVLWKSPFRIRMDEAVHAGTNDIEIRVTNLWANRLIGDDHLPEDFAWGEWTLKEWPEWLLTNTKRPSERITFTTWKHWSKDSPLQHSGLLGPVQIRSYVRKELN